MAKRDVTLCGCPLNSRSSTRSQHGTGSSMESIASYEHTILDLTFQNGINRKNAEHSKNRCTALNQFDHKSRPQILQWQYMPSDMQIAGSTLLSKIYF
jgi:hypothetical protein